jgi:hypothetical protein
MRRSPVLLLSTLLLASACATSSGDRSGPTVGSQGTTPSITVENDTATQFRVFLEVGGSEVLLGRVEGMRTARFNVPPASNGQLRLVVRPSAARETMEEHFSDPFSVQRGQRVSWQLRAPIGVTVPRISTIAVFSCEGEPNC